MMSGSELLPGRFANLALDEFVGERIKWTGMPDARRVFLIAGAIWLFAVPWTAFSLFWESITLSPFFAAKAPKMPDGLAIVFSLIGLPFVLVGFGMMAAPFYMLRRARRTLHVITDRRLATVTIGNTLEVESFRGHDISLIHRLQNSDGSGTLKVTVGRMKDSDGDSVAKVHELVGVTDVRRAEDLLLALKDS
jgi:hypothetical protein